MTWQLFLILLIVFELLADIFAKSYSLSGRLYVASIALLLYVVANMSWLVSLKMNSNLTIGANVFSIVTGIVAAIIGMGLYGEVITLKQGLGIILGVVSLTLLL